ncbi:MAG: hypothetical protein A2X61_08005 [Ignavibacteria bacterium GWB2_35_12]|nr:MAG: hypothetical protein A2X63_08035 [Ignavibacteria bacterium GWA2_35_8]OGU39526.1 MAG: hypothetical protein A2X61_08005 [Ignavibacteria bacterium GWB2_35_12]OGU96759.1 MAG: hypothetical protein A2220_14025 [Ignavibacteria bacterium RIFOXYA2_FULL_35_10]OGV21861.1 MAG: hypothetical protein A2475_09555 [Ignavibacteria bacterium RIFOXYC2_FULL_35_21]
MDRKVNIKTNPAVLKWARESLNISKSHAVESLDISTKQLEQIESGELPPTIDELKSMSKAYKRTIATLLLNAPPIEKPLPRDYRTIDSSRIGLFDEKTFIAVRKARALTQSLLELYNELNIKSPGFNWNASMNDNPAQLGVHFRELLKINEIPAFDDKNLFLEACIEKLEEVGIAIFQLSLTQDGIRGFSLIDEIIPVIILKRNEQPSAKVFTLFHELGHILLNEGGLCNIALSQNDPKIEQWCNTFSAELLVPSSLLMEQDLCIEYNRKNQKEWKHKDLVELSNRFNVGPLVILRRLLTLGKTTSDYYKEKHEIWNKPQFGRSQHPEGRNIAKETIKEKGRKYLSLVFRAYDLNKIDLKDTADFLGIKLSYITKTRQLFNSWM